MRIMASILLVSLCCGNSTRAQPPAQAGEVHCEPDKSAPNQNFEELEAKCLGQMKGIASRSGDELRLSLKGGGIKTFLSNKHACDGGDVEKCVVYRLAAYYPKQQLFVIESSLYESYDVFVVGGLTGAITKMDGFPHLSPSGKRLVVAFSAEAWETERDIAIYEAEKGGLRLEWSYKAKDYEHYELWEFTAWDGDGHIKLRVSSWITDSNGKQELATRNADIRRTNAGWRLNKPTNRQSKRAESGWQKLGLPILAESNFH